MSTGGARVRAYRLSYGQRSDTAPSRLTSVQEYGRDAILDDSGTVTGGTALPPLTMTYQDGVNRIGGQNRNTSVGGWDPAHIRDLFGDVNGDGRTDLVRVWQNGTDAWAQVTPSDGNGYALTASTFNQAIGGWDAQFRYYLADVTGDGRVDLVTLWNCGGNTCAQVNPSDGSGYPTRSFNEPVGAWDTTAKDFFADVNGDYRADFVRIWNNNGLAYALVRLSDGSGYPTASFDESVGGWWANGSLVMDHLADVTGDGRADLVRIWSNGDAFAQVTPSNGSGFPSSGTSFNASVGGWDPSNIFDYFGDVNADGKADLVRIWNDGLAFAQVSLSTGAGYPTQSFNAAVGSWDATNDRYYLADVNGDGRADLYQIWRNGSDAFLQINPSDGYGFPTTSFNESVGGWSLDWPFYAVEVNGDTKTDLVRIWNNGDSYAQVNLAVGSAPDLLSSLSNGIGGVVGVGYAWSSRWWSPGNNLPANFVTVAWVSRSDGRGSSFTTGYTFAGGAWARQPDERRFLGYRSSRAVIDSDGTAEEMLYRQTLAGAGLVEQSFLRDSAGQIYHREERTYQESTAPPYVSQLSRRERLECNLTPNCRHRRTEYTYDEYGNMLTEVDYGDTNVTTDDVTTATAYAANTDAYLVSLPATRSRYAGTSTAGTQLTRTVFFYDGAADATTPPPRGDTTRQDEWNSFTGGYLTTTSAFDTFGNTTSVTDPRGSTATTALDSTYHMFVTRACDALTHCTDTTWDFTLGEPSTVTDANAATTRHDYDPLGRETTSTDPDGFVTTWQYLDIGDPTQQRVRETLPDGSTDGLWTDTYVDGLGRAWQSVKEGPAPGTTYVQDRVYWSTTRLVWKESLWRQTGQPARYTEFGYDGAQRLTRTTHPDGTSSTFSYGLGADLEPTAVSRDELGHERITVSDVEGRTASVREKNGGDVYTTTYTRDPLGRLTGWTDAAGNTSTVAYNSLGWKTSMTDADAGTWTYEYDNAGLLTHQTDAKGQTTTVEYDALGRRTILTYPNGSQARWLYDESGYGASIGRLTRVTYPDGSEAHTWNARGLETSTTQCVDEECPTVGSEYDGLGRLTTLAYPDGETVSHTYDAAGRLTGVGRYVTSATWSPAGQLIGLDYGNGTSTTYTYDADREWLTAATVTGSAGILYQASYDFNAAGLVQSTSQGTPTPATTSYTYDDLNRLTAVSGAQTQTFTYDVVGDITSNTAVGTYHYDDTAHKHAVTTAGSQTYSYDSNGNLISGDGRTLTWDGGNRLASLTEGGATTTFAYDADERRLKKTNGGSVTRYFGRLIEDVDGSLVKYYYAGTQLVARSAAGTTTWYHADRLGSTRLLTDATGAGVRDYDYQSYGDVASTTGSAPNERTFTGHISDSETGLIYMAARYQDPKLGRFISPDTTIPDLADPQGLNRYSYARNNPVNNIDPTGHVAICECSYGPPADTEANPEPDSGPLVCHGVIPDCRPKAPPPAYPPTCDILPDCPPDPGRDMTGPGEAPQLRADYTRSEIAGRAGGRVALDRTSVYLRSTYEGGCLYVGGSCVQIWRETHEVRVDRHYLLIKLPTVTTVTGSVRNEHTGERFRYVGVVFEPDSEPGYSYSYREGRLVSPNNDQPRGQQVTDSLKGGSVSIDGQGNLGTSVTSTSMTVPGGEITVEHGVVDPPDLGLSGSVSITYTWLVR